MVASQTMGKSYPGDTCILACICCLRQLRRPVRVCVGCLAEKWVTSGWADGLEGALLLHQAHCVNDLLELPQASGTR